jgi:hypothetical protein
MREIYVDSRRRVDAHGNTYTLFLQSPLLNVKRAELVSATVPNTVYNINSPELFILDETETISVSNGFYSTCGLVEAVNECMSNSSPYKLSFLQNEGKFMMIGKNEFTMTILSSEFSNLTGFSGTLVSNLATSSNGIYLNNNGGYHFIKSPVVSNMKPWGEYVYLDIQELRRPFEIEAVTDPNSSQNSTIFAVIPLDVTSGHIKTFKEHTDYKISVEYPKPIDSIDRLTVRWLDYNGNVVNFNGVEDNALILRFYEEEIERFETVTEKEPEIPKISQKQTVFLFLVVSIVIILLIKRR